MGTFGVGQKKRAPTFLPDLKDTSLLRYLMAEKGERGERGGEREDECYEYEGHRYVPRHGGA